MNKKSWLNTLIINFENYFKFKKTKRLHDPIFFGNENPEYTKRIYFGPVKLRKFKIRLLNDKGFEVHLNDHDWSFSIYVTQLYQF